MTLRDPDELLRRLETMRVDTVTRNELWMRSNCEREESEHASNFNERHEQDTSDDEEQDKVTTGHMRSGQLYPADAEANKSLIKEISIN